MILAPINPRLSDRETSFSFGYKSVADVIRSGLNLPFQVTN